MPFNSRTNYATWLCYLWTGSLPTGIGRYAIELVGAIASAVSQPEPVLLTTERADPYALWGRYEHHNLPGCRLLPGHSARPTGGHPRGEVYRLDLLHDPNGVAPAAFATRIPQVVTIHDACAYVHPETHNRLDNWRYHWHLPWAARRADAVITDSADPPVWTGSLPWP